ncbi:MAG: agmatinase [Proteobacteria bacterium]|nr:agmatinase [Pseudomonadota bacterium]
MNSKNLERLRAKYTGDQAERTYNPRFSKVVELLFRDGTRQLPFAGTPRFLAAPGLSAPIESGGLDGLQVALAGIPMDLGVSNRSGARFGPRAVRGIERIGPYNAVLDCLPLTDLKVADVGDVPFRSRFSLESCHQDIESFFARIVAAGVAPLSVGGDHSVTHPILRALGARNPVGLIHIDAHCDTGGPFDGTRFHHGAPFRNAVLDGVLDPERCIQIGIRGSSEYLWEFSVDSGMTVISMEQFQRMGCEAVIRKAAEVVGDGPVYVTFDVDGLDPSFAPGTGTPEVGGLTTREVLQILHGLKGVNVVGGDVVEIAPQYDPTTNTVQIAAQILFEILSLMVFSPSIGRRAP